MSRKVLAVSLLGFLFAGNLFAIAPAGAAAVKISNGVLCTKLGAKSKVGATVYTCAKNPILNKTKLTWNWSGCVEAQVTYTKSQQSAIDLAASVVKNDVDTKAAADALATTMIGSINKMLEYKGNKDYLKGEIVWVRDVGYFKANVDKIAIDRTNANRPGSANTGAPGSASLWTPFVPAGVSALNAKLDLVPTPESAIAERKADISHWAAAIQKLNEDAKTLSTAKNLNASQKATLAAIPGYINSLSVGSTAASASVTSLESSVSTLKRLNNTALTNLQLATSQLDNSKLEISTNFSMRNQACSKGL